MTDIDTTNKFLVASSGSRIIIMMNHSSLTPDDALNLAAYLVATAKPFTTQKFDEVLKAVEES